MSKNIVICCDGTSNEFAKDHTNVMKLYQTLVHDQPAQATYYHAGLGTMEPAGALTTVSRKLTKLAGLAFGYGLQADIRDAYTYLMNHYEADDRIFLFGFSRGAYTVRALAALIRAYGVIRKGNETLAPYSIRMLHEMKGLMEGGQKDRAFSLADRFKETFGSGRCPIHFVGAWDTVKSVGLIENPLTLPFTAQNSSIVTACHAVALDERRAFFRSNLFHRDGAMEKPAGLKEVWFAGSHGDVGGGYPEHDSALSKVPLEWMLREARHAGLSVDAAKEAMILGTAAGSPYVKADPNALVHDSLTWNWKPLEYYPKLHREQVVVNGVVQTKNGKPEYKNSRYANLGRRRRTPVYYDIHDSVLQRDPAYVQALPKGYRPVATRPVT